MNWIWIVAIILVVFFVMHQGGLVRAETVSALLKQNPILIDVRTAEEFQRGHVNKAIHIPLSDLEQRIAETVPDKAQPVLLYCRSGARSGAGKKRLEKLGYTNVHNLGSVARARSLTGF